MQLVTQFIDPSDATEANSRLRKAGVMTEITSLDPHIMSRSRTGALRIGLWVVFEDQFDDAVQLLEYPTIQDNQEVHLSTSHMTMRHQIHNEVDILLSSVYQFLLESDYLYAPRHIQRYYNFAPL